MLKKDRSGIRFGGSWGDNDISYPMYRDFRDGNQVFSGMFCRYPTSVSLGYGDRTDRVAAELVSGSYFPVLGVTTVIGRTLTPDDDRVPGGHPVAMLSFSFWQSRFSSDPSIVGKQIVINEYTFTVIGVSPPGFDGVEVGYKSRLFIPMMMQAQMTPLSDRLEDRSLSWVTAFGRLKPGIDIAQAKASLQPLMHNILEVEVQEPTLQHYSDYDRTQFLKNSVDLLPGSQGWSGLREHMQTPLWVLAALSGAVLLLDSARVRSGACDSRLPSRHRSHTEGSSGLGSRRKTGVPAQAAGKRSDGFGVVAADWRDFVFKNFGQFGKLRTRILNRAPDSLHCRPIPQWLYQ